MAPTRRAVPLWLKIVWTTFVAVLVPVYWVHYGPSNFLWFSDIALFLITAALWLESRLLASIAAISVLPLEALWNLEFFTRLGFWAFGHGTADWLPIRLTVYMWDESRELAVRLLSLFHVPMPPLMIWLLWKLGYDRRALVVQTLLAWIVLPMSYWLARPDNNINWTLGFGTQQPNRLIESTLVHLALLMVAFPVVIYVPMHLLLNRMFGVPRKEDRKRSDQPHART
jgi:hypothetical protein